MYRGVLLFTAFAVVSPVFRGYVFDAYSVLEQAVNRHTTVAYMATGALGFVSFLAIKLTARK